MNELTNLIASNRDILTRRLQEETSSILDLHLPECVINNNLSPQQLYNELSLHAYAYHRAVWILANTDMSLVYQGFLPNEPEVINEVLETVYIPKAKRMIKDHFDKLYSNNIDSTFYEQLPNVADYIGLKYLRHFLPSDRLPKIRKPRMGNKRSKIEIDFIKEASDLTVYDRGVLIKKPNRGYSQYCQWGKCENRTEFNSVYHYEAFNNPLFNPANGCGLYYLKNGQPLSIRVIKLNQQKSKPKLFFLCSKNCYDALRMNLKRKHQLSN